MFIFFPPQRIGFFWSRLLGQLSNLLPPFYISGHIESALTFLTLVECGRQVLPGLNLPQKEKALAYLLASLGTVFIFTSYWPLNFLENRSEWGTYLAIAITFIFIAAYSRYLGLSWSRLLAGVTATLGLLCLVESAARAMYGHLPSCARSAST